MGAEVIMPDHKKELYSSFLNNKPIRTLKNEGKEWFLFKDILLALGYSRSTAESGSSYQSQAIPDIEKTRFTTELIESPRRKSHALFVSQKGAEIFISDCGKGATVRTMKIVRGEDGTPPPEPTEDIAYNEELIEQLLNDPELFIALLRRYQREKIARRQKEEALNNIMQIIEAA